MNLIGEMGRATIGGDFLRAPILHIHLAEIRNYNLKNETRSFCVCDELKDGREVQSICAYLYIPMLYYKCVFAWLNRLSCMAGNGLASYLRVPFVKL